ncbi:MAG: hypothetical protein KAW16_09455, partial [candidate division Zixibacteria bacterium]|nr:hypothetical protein [candidate division Zixibacteria bacterium]
VEIQTSPPVPFSILRFDFAHRPEFVEGWRGVHPEGDKRGEVKYEYEIVVAQFIGLDQRNNYIPGHAPIRKS